MNKEYINKINFLIEDEYEAIDGYNEVIDFFEASAEHQKSLIIDQLEHIKKEEEEHIRELEELKKMLEDTSYTPKLDILEEARKPSYSYRYEGPIYRFDKAVVQTWEGATQAVSEKQALNNLRYQAGKALGLDVGSHRIKIELDPDCLFKVEDDDYFDIDDFEIPEDKYCDKCGTHLSDGGYCPKCDDGEEDY